MLRTFTISILSTKISTITSLVQLRNKSSYLRAITLKQVVTNTIRIRRIRWDRIKMIMIKWSWTLARMKWSKWMTRQVREESWTTISYRWWLTHLRLEQLTMTGQLQLKRSIIMSIIITTILTFTIIMSQSMIWMCLRIIPVQVKSITIIRITVITYFIILMTRSKNNRVEEIMNSRLIIIQLMQAKEGEFRDRIPILISISDPKKIFKIGNNGEEYQINLIYFSK